VSFAAITLCVTFQRVFIIVIDVVYFVMTQSGTFGYTLVYIDSITKYTPIFGINRCCPLQTVMAAKLTKLTHKIEIQLHLVAESCTIYSSHSRRPV
jgi:hypothetical protein